MSDPFHDANGFYCDDPRHERWIHGEKPADGSEPVLDAIRAFEDVKAFGAERESDNGWPLMLGIGRKEDEWPRCYVARYPDKAGHIGCSISPQYCIRRDAPIRGPVGEVVARAVAQVREGAS